ncbi:hypothetical protein ACLOJK_016193 [Asimina triloba]
MAIGISWLTCLINLWTIVAIKFDHCMYLRGTMRLVSDEKANEWPEVRPAVSVQISVKLLFIASVINLN